MVCLIVSAIFFIVLLPLFVTWLEKYHYWTILADWFIRMIDKVFRTGIKQIPYKSDGPNTPAHQHKTLRKWVLIGFILELILIVVKHLLIHN